MAKGNEDKLDTSSLPAHVAIIMDGNGRWAKKRFLPRYMGHRAGMDALRRVVESCRELGIGYLTVYAFSTENWKRPRREVEYLMRLLVEYMEKEIAELNRQGIRVQILGDITPLEGAARTAIERAIEITKENREMVFSIALNYGSRSEITRAVEQIVDDVLAGKIERQEVCEGLIQSRLYTVGMPDPDLLIRTAGEKRVSNFMLWQLAYSELFVTEILWPDFDRGELTAALIDYQKRERRFGGLTASEDE